MELEISALGFEKTAISIAAGDQSALVCNLSPAPRELDQVVVTAPADWRTIRGTMGAMVVVSTSDRFSREINDWFPKKDVIIYPNPVHAENNIEAVLQLKDKGEYQLVLADAGGRVVWMSKASVRDAKYILSIPTQSTWSAGIYWLRVSGRLTKKVYHGKIVLQ